MKEWTVGDRYTVIEDGHRLRGTITAIGSDGYTVQWSDGRVTIELQPDPAREFAWVRPQQGKK